MKQPENRDWDHSAAEPSSKEAISLSIGRKATMACLLEVSAAKPGNVHRAADFEDVTFEDFAVSAIVLGQCIDDTETQSVGETILRSASATRSTVDSNTNLGTILIVCPLAKCALSGKVDGRSVQDCLGQMSSADSRDIYHAIRLANPGGLGNSPQHDVAGSAPDDLLTAMQVASDRDLIARQYCNGFEQVFEVALPLILQGRKRFGRLDWAIIYSQVEMLNRFGDSLIARKCGDDVSAYAQFLAGKAIDALAIGHQRFWQSVGELDFWMRSDGHRRNPGTTADMIAAAIFVGIHNGDINPPYR